jgi:hypothetical protein
MAGCALYQFIYPGNIRVSPGEVFFDFEGIRFCLAISQQAKSVNSLSINNEIKRVPCENTEGYKYEFDHQLGTSNNQICKARSNSNGELDVSLLMDTNGVNHKRLSHSALITYVRVAIETDSLNSDVQSKAISALNYFIRVYRYASRDVSIKETAFMSSFRPFYIVSFHKYNKNELDLVHDQRVYQLLSLWKPQVESMHSLQPDNLLDEEIPNFDRAKATGEIAYYLSSSNFPEWKETVMRAYEMAYEKLNYNAAILEVFISLEVSLFRMVNNITIPAGVSLNKYNNVNGLIEDAFPKLFANSADELKSKIHIVRKVRNDIVHDGYQATEEQCETALGIVDEAFKFIDTKI